MAGSQPTVIGSSGSGARFQSLEDFQKEQDELQAQIDKENLAAQLAKSRNGSPATKKAKITPDIGALLMESQALEEMGEGNWVGKLLEYHQARGLKPAPVYTDIQISEQRFRCTVTITQNPEPISSLISFANKKAAKQFISKLAIDRLITQNRIPPDGSIKVVKTLPVIQTPQPKKLRPTNSSPSSSTTNPFSPSTSPTSSPNSPSYPSLIPHLCQTLGLNVPTYKIAPMTEGIPIYHGYADFGSDPWIVGKVGEFRDIYGKKKAKEVCAKIVWLFLKDIERQRVKGIEDAMIEGAEGRKRESEMMEVDMEKKVVIVHGI